MRKLTRTLVKRFWGLCAFLLISLAVLVTVGRELAPQLGRYGADIEQSLSNAMGVQVSIGSIAATWDGLSPELQLQDVRLESAAGEEILAFAQAEGEVDLLRSLLHWQVVLKGLSLAELDMGFRQSEDGSWSLPGIGPWSPGDDAIDVNDPLDIFLLADRIEVRRANFSFAFRSGHNSHVELPQLTLQNSGNFHRLRSEVAVDRNRDVLSLVVEAEGDPRNRAAFKAQGYLRLQQFELDKALAALPGRWWDGLPDQEWRKGHQLNVEAWFDLSPGMEISTRGWLDIGELPVSLDQTVALPQRTQARFAGHWASSGAWQLALRDLQLQWEEAAAPSTDILLSSANLGQPVHLQTQVVDLDRWTETLSKAQVLRGAAGEALAALRPRGTLRNVRVSMAGRGIADLRLRANLEDVAVSAWHGAPELKQVNGYVEGSPFKGYVDLASDAGFSMFYPTIYHESLSFEQAHGQVHWHIDPEAGTVDVHSGLLAVSGDVGEGRGYFSLSIPLDFGSRPEELVVQVGLRDSAARFHKRFAPHVLPDPLLKWLEDSVGEGKVTSGGFIYRGGLRRELAQHATTQLFLNVENATLSYAPQWPALEAADGVVWLDDRRIRGELRSGRILDTQLSSGQLHVDVAADGEIQLGLAGETVGDAADGLRLLRESPLGGFTGLDLAEWKAEGPMRTAFDLSIPLGAPDRLEIRRFNIELSGAELYISQARLPLKDLAGRVEFSPGEGLRSKNLSASLWGEPLRAEVLDDVQTRPDENSKAERFRLAIAGDLQMSALRQWIGRPELELAEGKTRFEASLPLTVSPSGLALGPAIGLKTDLQGVSIHLPEPFGKSAQASRHLDVKLPLGGSLRELSLRYGDLLHGLLRIEGDQVTGAALAFGGQASAPLANILSLTGRLEKLAPLDWQPVLDRYRGMQAAAEGTSPGTPWRVVIDLRADKIHLDNLEVTDLHLTGDRTAERWQLRLDSDQLAGQAQFYADGRAPITLELAHLRLPKPAIEPELPPYLRPFVAPEAWGRKDMWADLDPSVLPPINFAVREFSLDGEDFGTWSFQLRPTDTGVVARQIIGTIRGGQIVGLDLGQGAELFWDKVDGEVSSRFVGRFVTSNLGSVLRQWNQPHLLDSESSIFDARLNWAGSPAAVSVTDLQGDMIMNIKRGTFIRGAGEASTGSALLQLIAFFNFDTWLRRLRLDFSDLTRSGTSFETIEGALSFDKGKVYMNTPVVVNSSSSRFQMAGVVDLVRSELDTKLVATLPVGGNLTFVAALAGMGLPGVAGMWLISKVFEEQIGKMSSLSFNVTGPLDDPEMDFVRLFDDQAVQEDVSARAEGR